MEVITDYYKSWQATRKELIDTINSFLELDVESYDDYFEGHEKIHIVYYEEGGRPYHYKELKVRRYCKNYVLAYTNDYDLIKEFDGRKWIWTPEEHRNLMFVGDYIIKIPYRLIALEDLYHIADLVCNEEEDEDLGANWNSFLQELDDDD